MPSTPIMGMVKCQPFSWARGSLTDGAFAALNDKQGIVFLGRNPIETHPIGDAHPSLAFDLNRVVFLCASCLSINTGTGGAETLGALNCPNLGFNVASPTNVGGASMISKVPAWHDSIISTLSMSCNRSNKEL